MIDHGDDTVALRLHFVLILGIQVAFLARQLGGLGLEVLAPVRDLVVLSLDGVDLVAELLEDCLVLSRGLLSLLEFEQLSLQFLVESARFLHERRLVLHVLRQRLVQSIELLLGFLSGRRIEFTISRQLIDDVVCLEVLHITGSAARWCIIHFFCN